MYCSHTWRITGRECGPPAHPGAISFGIVQGDTPRNPWPFGSASGIAQDGLRGFAPLHSSADGDLKPACR